jgi:hypothetical protein
MYLYCYYKYKPQKNIVMATHSIYSKVQAMSNAVNGALSSPEVLGMLSVYGYTQEKINEGAELAANVMSMMTLQTKEYGDKFTSTEELTKMFGECYGRYMIIIKLARITFKNEKGILYTLRATGKRKRSYSGWLSDARALYGNLLQNVEWVNEIGRFGVTRERLESEYSLVQEFERLYHNKLKEAGEAQQMTKDRDDAIDELSNWHSDFRAVARIALYEKPQLLEILGIVVK